MRTGEYKKINVVAVKEGELGGFDPFNEQFSFNPIQDFGERAKAKTIGYYAMFEMLNGFTKGLYWSKEQMEAHAIQYSMGYRAKKGYTFWEKDFDSMANKTMLRQLLSKWGLLSGELQRAYQSDMAVIKDDLSPEYVDNSNEQGSDIEIEVQDDVDDQVDFNEIGSGSTNINDI